MDPELRKHLMIRVETMKKIQTDPNFGLKYMAGKIANSPKKKVIKKKKGTNPRKVSKWCQQGNMNLPPIVPGSPKDKKMGLSSISGKAEYLQDMYRTGHIGLDEFRDKMNKLQELITTKMNWSDSSLGDYEFKQYYDESSVAPVPPPPDNSKLLEYEEPEEGDGFDENCTLDCQPGNHKCGK